MADMKPETRPACFATLEKIFPLGADGLRHSPPECLECEIKTECLRSALRGQKGVAVREERLARSYHAGSVGFLQRWARQKQLRQPTKTYSLWRRLRMRLLRRPC